MHYVKVEFTRQLFQFWEWELRVSEEIFVGPFESRKEGELTMELILQAKLALLCPKKYEWFSCQSLTSLPSEADIFSPRDADDYLAYLISG